MLLYMENIGNWVILLNAIIKERPTLKVVFQICHIKSFFYFASNLIKDKVIRGLELSMFNQLKIWNLLCEIANGDSYMLVFVHW